MNCRACEDLLQVYLDGADLATGPDLEQHLRDCSDCAARLTGARCLVTALRRLAPLALPAGLADRLTAAICADRAEALRLHRPRWRLRALAGLAAAACLLLALGLGWNRLRGPVGPAEEIAKGTTPRPFPPAPVTPVPGRPVRPGPAKDVPVPLRQSMAEAGSAVASLTARTAEATVGETASLWPLVEAPPMAEDLTQPLEPSARPFREAGAELSAGLGPVAGSARRAVGLFLRDLPSTAKGLQDNPS